MFFLHIFGFISCSVLTSIITSILPSKPEHVKKIKNVTRIKGKTDLWSQKHATESGLKKKSC